MNECRLFAVAQNSLGIAAFIDCLNRLSQNFAEHDYTFVRRDEVLQTVQRDRSLTFDGFFVVGMTLCVFVAGILAAGWR